MQKRPCFFKNRIIYSFQLAPNVFQVVSFDGRGRAGAINFRALMNAIFFADDRKHPNQKSQRSSRKRDLDIYRSRALKQKMYDERNT